MDFLSGGANLIPQAMSRARMRSPQNNNSEASRNTRRGARGIALQARRRQARDLGIPL
jgi:hypothetical protein